MLDRFDQYGYQGIFLALLASGMGVPIPEELPVIMAGILVGHEDTTLKWYIMLPVVIAGVVIGDGILYAMGRFWGTWLLSRRWVQRRILPAEKRAQIEKNFHDRGIAVLLGARLLPGIRTPIFLMAGVLRVPLGRFLIADGIYAIPGVNVLFWLAYVLTDQVLVIFNQINAYRPQVVLVVLSFFAGFLAQRFLFMRKVSTGESSQVPQIIAKPAEAVAHAVEKAAEVVGHMAHVGHHHEHGGQHLDPKADVVPEPPSNGPDHTPAEQPKHHAG